MNQSGILLVLCEIRSPLSTCVSWFPLVKNTMFYFTTPVLNQLCCIWRPTKVQNLSCKTVVYFTIRQNTSLRIVKHILFMYSEIWTKWHILNGKKKLSPPSWMIFNLIGLKAVGIFFSNLYRPLCWRIYTKVNQMMVENYLECVCMAVLQSLLFCCRFYLRQNNLKETQWSYA